MRASAINTVLALGLSFATHVLAADDLSDPFGYDPSDLELDACGVAPWLACIILRARGTGSARR